MRLEPNEAIAFRHQTKYNKVDGELVVTTLRFLWLPSDKSENIQHTWANVAKIFYSPPPSAKIKITTVAGNLDLVFVLVGSSKEACINELAALKIIITNIRKGKSSEGNGGVNLREKLLIADRILAKQYRDMVEVNKLVTEDEFWATHYDALQIYEATVAAKSQKGRDNFVMTSIIKEIKSGNGDIDLTADKKRSIFALYPAVRRAYEIEVPLKKTEKEFWESFFLSVYLNSSKTDEDGHQNKLGDFAKYETKEDYIPTIDSKKKLSGKVNPEFDLTAVYGDYHSHEALDLSDRTSEGFKMATSFNRNSQLVVGESSDTKTADKVEIDRRIASTELEELHVRNENSYVRINVKKNKTQDFITGNQSSSGSAFAKSTNATKRYIDGSTKLSNALLSTGELLSSVDDAIPNADKAEKFLLEEIGRRRFEGTGKQIILSMQSSINHGNDDSNEEKLGDEFRQVMIFPLKNICKV